MNRAFVKAYEGEDNADPAKILGETLLSYGKNRKSEVVGVLDDEHQVSVAEQSQPEIEGVMPQITPDPDSICTRARRPWRWTLQCVRSAIPLRL